MSRHRPIKFGERLHLKRCCNHNVFSNMVAGLAGALVASAATAGSDNAGPAEFIPLDEPTARTTLAELQLAL